MSDWQHTTYTRMGRCSKIPQEIIDKAITFAEELSELCAEFEIALFKYNEQEHLVFYLDDDKYTMVYDGGSNRYYIWAHNTKCMELKRT